MMLLCIFTCIFVHCVIDFHLQGILASLKQRAWWEIEAKNKLNKKLKDTKYSKDYWCALLIHAFEWSFATFFFLFYISSFNNIFKFAVLVGVNTVIHAFIDNEKANKLSLNMWEDQLLHIIQIVAGCYFWF